jgi:hypothetical protein
MNTTAALKRAQSKRSRDVLSTAPELVKRMDCARFTGALGWGESLPSLEGFPCLDELAEPTHVDLVLQRIASVAGADHGQRIQLQMLKGGTLGRGHLGRVRLLDLEVVEGFVERLRAGCGELAG